MKPPPAELNHDLAIQYEQLRKDALSLRAGYAIPPGLALFLRNGMLAWMRAWSPCKQNANPETAPQSNSPHAAPHCSLEIRTQMAAILASMILGQQWEAT